MRNWAARWGDSVSWLAYTSLGIALPVSCGAFFAAAFGYNFSWWRVAELGQLAAYSVALLTAAAYLMVKSSPSKLRGMGLLGAGLIVLPMFAGLNFACGLVLEYNPSFSANVQVIRVGGLVVFLLSFIVAFIAVVEDNRRALLDRFKKDYQAQADDLANDFDKKVAPH